jgi:hypothetical protein
MLKLHEPRLWTALIVVGVSLFAISRGVDVARFAHADISEDQSSMAARLGPWTEKPGVAALALSRLVGEAPGDADMRRRWATDLLSRAPLDADAWLLLARLRFAAAAPAEQGATALAMSSLTGPNEGWIMARRGALALSLWRVLPPASRGGAASDLVGGWYYAPEQERAVLRATLSLQTPSLREDMRAALLLAGGAAVAETLGLNAAPAAGAAP